MTFRLSALPTAALHGAIQTLSVPVVVDAGAERIVVTAAEPVLLDAAAFEFGGDIAKLAELAKLKHVPMTVPVSFSLEFRRGDAGT